MNDGDRFGCSLRVPYSTVVLSPRCLRGAGAGGIAMGRRLSLWLRQPVFLFLGLNAESDVIQERLRMPSTARFTLHTTKSAL